MDIINNRCLGSEEQYIKYTSLSISTMTVCFNFNQMIPLNELKESLSKKTDIFYNPHSKKSKIPKKKGTDSFYNSFDLKMSVVDTQMNPYIFSNVSVFIFPNGKVKIAGIKTMNTVHLLIDELIDIITEYSTIKKPLVAENILIQMICSDFKIKPTKEDSDGWCIKQETLKNILVNDYSLSATFSALSRYPGINVKKKSLFSENKNISLLIFRSGSIIITGAKNIEDIIDAYNLIVDITRKHYCKLFYFDINEEIKQKKKKKLI